MTDTRNDEKPGQARAEILRSIFRTFSPDSLQFMLGERRARGKDKWRDEIIELLPELEEQTQPTTPPAPHTGP